MLSLVVDLFSPRNKRSIWYRTTCTTLFNILCVPVFLILSMFAICICALIIGFLVIGSVTGLVFAVPYLLFWLDVRLGLDDKSGVMLRLISDENGTVNTALE